MAAHPIYIGKSVEVGSGRRPLRGLENRRPKGYAGSSPVPSAISFQRLTLTTSSSSFDQGPFVPIAAWRAILARFSDETAMDIEMGRREAVTKPTSSSPEPFVAVAYE